MAILASDIASRMRQTGLDAEGTDHYRDDIDLIPAINSSITWMVSVINTAFAGKKFTEEIARELTKMKVWQTNNFSRFKFSEAETGHKLWTVLSVHPKPKVWMADFDQQDLTNYSAAFSAFVLANNGSEYDNAPIIAFDPDTGALLEPHESTFRPDLTYVSSEKSAKRLTADEYVRNRKNPFEHGNVLVDCDDLLEYAYLNMTDYNSMVGGYVTVPTHEFEVRPDVKKQLVAMSYISVPEQITALTQTVPFPHTMFDIIVAKALQFVSYKQGDQTNLFSVTQMDIQTLLTATN